MSIIKPNLSTGNVEQDIQRDKTVNKIKDLCSLMIETIDNPNSKDYDDDENNTYLNNLNSLVKQFVDQARGTYYVSGYDGFIKILQHCDNLTKSFNEPKYDES